MGLSFLVIYKPLFPYTSEMDSFSYGFLQTIKWSRDASITSNRVQLTVATSFINFVRCISEFTTTLTQQLWCFRPSCCLDTRIHWVVNEDQDSSGKDFHIWTLNWSPSKVLYWLSVQTYVSIFYKLRMWMIFSFSEDVMCLLCFVDSFLFP